jgi:hypothetical protein
MARGAADAAVRSREAGALASQLGSAPGGLTSGAAAGRLADVGPNSVDEAARMGGCGCSPASSRTRSS